MTRERVLVPVAMAVPAEAESVMKEPASYVVVIPGGELGKAEFLHSGAVTALRLHRPQLR